MGSLYLFLDLFPGIREVVVDILSCIVDVSLWNSVSKFLFDSSLVSFLNNSGKSLAATSVMPHSMASSRAS